MRTLVVSVLALTAMASAALAADAPKVTNAADAPKVTKAAPAGPVQLTSAQLEQVVAGVGFFLPVSLSGIGGQGGCFNCRGGGDGISFNFGD